MYMYNSALKFDIGYLNNHFKLFISKKLVFINHVKPH